MAFRRRAFDLWPGFDERLGRGVILDGGEEHHAFFSLIDRGYRVVYTPDAVVHHPCPRDHRGSPCAPPERPSASTGYITLLFVEEPRYRRKVFNYVLEALQGTPRTWRIQSQLHPGVLFLDGDAARCKGPWTVRVWSFVNRAVTSPRGS